MSRVLKLARRYVHRATSATRSPTNLTTVKIWKSGYSRPNGFKPSFLPYAMLRMSNYNLLEVPNAGQFTLETDNFHIHVQPKQLLLFNAKTANNSTGTVVPHFVTDTPHHVVRFQNLDSKKIKDWFENFMQISKPSSVTDNVHNYEVTNGCDFLYNLLMRSGIRTLIPREYSIRDYVLVTPNNLSAMLLRAGLVDEQRTKHSDVMLLGDPLLTRIRIWNSGYFAEDNSFVHSNIPSALIKTIIQNPNKVSNVGHVSVETKGFYASLWPSNLTIFNKLKIHDGENSTIKQDIVFEGRPPDCMIDFCSLDVLAISKAIEKHVASSTEKSNGVYHLMGIHANSCSTLAYQLLVAGGIRKLAPFHCKKLDFSIVTPNNLAKMILRAKETEGVLSQSIVDNNSRGIGRKCK